MFFYALIYLAIPTFIALFALFNFPFVIIASISLTILIFSIYKSCEKDYKSFYIKLNHRHWLLLAMSAFIVGICVSYPHNGWDWGKHHSVLNLLASNSWPPTLEIDNEKLLLRYYLSWYMIPALFSKISHTLLHPVNFIWTFLGVFIALYLAFHHLTKQYKMKYIFVATVVFFFFSGWDVVGAYAVGDFPPVYPNWLQLWSGWGEIFPNLFNISWTPQHALPAWLGACMFLHNRRLTMQYAVLIGAVASMWSPLVTIGLVPLFAYGLYKEGIKNSLTLQNLLSAPLIAVPIVLYLSSGTPEASVYFKLVSASLSSRLMFWTLEFILAAVAIFYADKEKKELILVCTVSLILLTLVDLHPDRGSLIIRTTAPFICILSVLAAKALLKSRGMRKELLIGYLLIGGITPAIVFVGTAFPWYPRADKNISFDKTQYANPPHRYFYWLQVESVPHVMGFPLLRTYESSLL